MKLNEFIDVTMTPTLAPLLQLSPSFLVLRRPGGRRLLLLCLPRNGVGLRGDAESSTHSFHHAIGVFRRRRRDLCRRCQRRRRNALFSDSGPDAYFAKSLSATCRYFLLDFFLSRSVDFEEVPIHDRIILGCEMK